MNKEGKHNFKLLSYLLVFFVALFVVNALTSENDSPNPNVWITDQRGEFNFTCVGLNDTYDANLSIDFLSNGSYQLMETDLAVANNTLSNFTLESLQDGTHQWTVTCFNTTQSSSATSSAWAIKLDSTNPVSTYTTPYNASQLYYTDTAVTFGAICTDDNPNEMFYDIDGVRNATRNYESGTLNNYQVNLADGVHYWNAMCDDDAGLMGSNETNTTFIVDTTAPAWTLVSPTDASWDLDGSIDVVGTLVENNLRSCELWEGTAAAGVFLNQSNAVNGTDFETLTYTDGDYIFNTNCTDLAGFSEWSSNYTFSVDTADPFQINLTSPTNLTTGTDLTPIFTWANVTETNFLKYTLMIDTNVEFSSPDYIQDITTNTNTVELDESLLADTTYFWTVNITATSGRGGSPDEAARQYSTDSTCGTTYAGYNFCGIVRDDTAVWDSSYTVTEGITANQIQLETGASYVYKFNASHDFITYQSGTTTNKYMNFTTGEAAIFYMGADSTWPVAGYAGRVWNGDATDPLDDTWNVNFTNSSDGYNLFSVRVQTGRTFSNIKDSFIDQGWNSTNTPDGNASMLYLSYVNNSGSAETCTGATDCGQYVPNRYNRTINDATTIDFGEVIWAYLNGATKEGQSAYWNRSCDFTVDGSCGSAGAI